MLVLDMGRAALKPVLIGAAFIGALALSTVASQAADPLPSWNDGPAKQSILTFVEKVTTAGSPDSCRGGTDRHLRQRRHAVVREPAPVQMYFALDRVKALAHQHPEWKNQRTVCFAAEG